MLCRRLHVAASLQRCGASRRSSSVSGPVTVNPPPPQEGDHPCRAATKNCWDLHVYWKRRPLTVVRVHCARARSREAQRPARRDVAGGQALAADPDVHGPRASFATLVHPSCTPAPRLVYAPLHAGRAHLVYTPTCYPCTGSCTSVANRKGARRATPAATRTTAEVDSVCRGVLGSCTRWHCAPVYSCIDAFG